MEDYFGQPLRFVIANRKMAALRAAVSYKTSMHISRTLPGKIWRKVISGQARSGEPTSKLFCDFAVAAVFKGSI